MNYTNPTKMCLPARTSTIRLVLQVGRPCTCAKHPGPLFSYFAFVPVLSDGPRADKIGGPLVAIFFVVANRNQ